MPRGAHPPFYFCLWVCVYSFHMFILGLSLGWCVHLRVKFRVMCCVESCCICFRVMLPRCAISSSCLVLVLSCLSCFPYCVDVSLKLSLSLSLFSSIVILSYLFLPLSDRAWFEATKNGRLRFCARLSLSSIVLCCLCCLVVWLSCLIFLSFLILFSLVTMLPPPPPPFRCLYVFFHTFSSCLLLVSWLSTCWLIL
jgi:hypothetical protein